MTAARTWSTEQNSIFEWFETPSRGNLIVRARAGTGKTTTIIEGVNRAPDRQILLAAFSKADAKELQSRVTKQSIEAKTLHGLGFKYVRRNWNVRMDDANPWKRGSALVERVEPNAPIPMHKLVRDLHTKARDIDPWLATDPTPDGLYHLAVKFDLLPDAEWESRQWDAKRVCTAAHKAMKLAMERTDLIDFADMIFLPLIHSWVRPWFDMVVVDEAQDMTVAQLTLAVGACRKDGRLCVVGDDKQAIYGFRGADSDSLDRLKDGLNAKELGLTVTYRCPKLVVALAAELVPDFTAADAAPEGEISTVDVEKMVLTAAEGDFILSRTNAPLVRACLALLRRGVRAKIKGRDVGKGIISLISKLGATSVDDIPGLLSVWVSREVDRAHKKLPDDAATERISIIMDQAAIVEVLIDGATSMGDVERRCNDLFSDDDNRASVMLSTVHRAKGREADTVYLLQETFRNGSAEEQNIMYVAITRSKRRLIWVVGE